MFCITFIMTKGNRQPSASIHYLQCICKLTLLCHQSGTVTLLKNNMFSNYPFKNTIKHTTLQIVCTRL